MCMIVRPVSTGHFDLKVFVPGRNETWYIYSLLHLLRVVTEIVSYTVLCCLLDRSFGSKGACLTNVYDWGMSVLSNT